MEKYHVTKTYWTVNGDGDLIHVGSSDPAWRTVTKHATDFPLSPDQVASLMNHAFEMGMKAKVKHIREVLSID
jgi:hypothetical protein